MDSAEANVGGTEQALQSNSSLRWQTADLVLDRLDVIVADTVAVFPFSSPQRLETAYCVKLGATFTRALAEAVRTGAVDARSSYVFDLIAVASQRALTPEQVFTFAYLSLSTVIDEISLDQQLGAATDPYPQVTQYVRRGVFDVLAAWASRAIDTPTIAAITDVLTTLHSRPVLEVAVFKECHRAERFEHWMSMILLDVDNLAEINRTLGYGVGDRVLERLGILLRTYFRQHDWVARYREDTIAVLLPETGLEDALALAERTRAMVQDRLTFRDYRTEQRASITVTLAVASARALEGEPIDSERFLLEAEAALERSKASGRTRIEHIAIPPRLISIDEAAKMLRTDLQGIERLVGNGTLEPVQAGRHVRLDRSAVMRVVNSA
jgi:diguanylate cyclase (GGDEF)-like protein/excisionase family DNA binding protein